MDNVSPFLSFFIHDILYLFIDCLMDVKSKYEIMPFILLSIISPIIFEVCVVAAQKQA